MFENIHFIGGIHGSGKGYTSNYISKNTNLIHIEASKVLKWKNISNQEDKLVNDISITQDILINNLKATTLKSRQYLLDGHFCLINKSGEIERVDLKTFENINPLSFSIKLEDVLVIKKRLEERDSKKYDLEFLNNFQNVELIYAKFLSEKLSTPLFILNDEMDNFIKFLNP